VSKARDVPALPPHQRELLRGPEVAAILGVKRGKFYHLRAEKLIPEPVMLDSVPVWRRRELLDWIDSGCPAAADWKWQATLPVKLDELIALKTRNAAALADEIKELQARVAAGHELVHLVNTR
jgi:predicted DNA-binding transcriptional regulator AlpA